MSNCFGNSFYYLFGDPNKKKFISAVDLDMSLGFCPDDSCWYPWSRLLPKPLSSQSQIVSLYLFGDTGHYVSPYHLAEYLNKDFPKQGGLSHVQL